MTLLLSLRSCRVEEGSIIGKPEHDWQRPPGYGNIWFCRSCPVCTTYNGDNLLAEPHYEIPWRAGVTPGWSSYLEGHDRMCPCLCVACSGEYDQILKRQTARRTLGEITYSEFLTAVADESNAWTLRRKQIDEGYQEL